MSKAKSNGFTDSLGSLSSIFESREPAKVKESGEYQHLPLDEIVEDPHQPRKEFDEEFLKSLAADIKARGVKTPISVKPKNADGKYVINFGANRYRGSIMAGKKDIPAVIDANSDAYDQVNENIKRKNLSARDIATWIQGRLDMGDDRKTIMERLDVTASFLTQHLAILKMPDDIMAMLYDSGVVTEGRLLYEISLSLKMDKEATYAFCREIESNGGSSLVEIDRFKQALKAKKKEAESKANPPAGEPTGEPGAGASDQDPTLPSGPGASEAEEEENTGDNTQVSPKVPSAKSTVSEYKKPVIGIRYDGHEGRLLYMTPAQDGHVWIELIDSSSHEVPANQVSLVSISESS